MELSEQGFRIERRFAAPLELVYRLWTEPAYVSLWWGIAGSSIVHCDLDVRPGGRWRIDMQTASGKVYRNEGAYLEVVTNERLAFSDIPHASTSEWEGNLPGPRHHVVRFAPVGAATRVELDVSFASAADRDRHIGFGMPTGLSESLDRLESLIETLRVTVPG